ncbi:uncharacterized protein LOC135847691 [Planococcus citri]|uniref:uncharacterized protein LOC135847691 n=1 Tax=Planococcus citri TaxID=170843 RepID=UPI0031F9DF70
MNSNCSVTFFYISIIITINAIRFALGLYEPVIYLDAPKFHHFGYLKVEVEEDDSHTSKHYLVKTIDKNQEIFVACPNQDPDHPNTFAIHSTEVGKAAATPICEHSVESQIYFTNKIRSYNAVGFLIYAPDKSWPDQDFDVPEHHLVVELIQFKFDKYDEKIISLRYFMYGGEFPQLELIRQEDDLRKYRKNLDIYKNDIDTFYSPRNCPFVKVPLAPEEDFLFDYWKSASRQNIFTAPMWRDLLAQWQALEIFIRKVTQITDWVGVETGIYEELTRLPDGLRNPLFENIEWPDDQYRIPRYFWKTVSLLQEHEGQNYDYGILFIMHNVPNLDPNNEWNIEKICTDYNFVDLGWTFLQNDHFKSPMYACPINDVTMNYLGEISHEEYEDFNLNLLSLFKVDDEGNGYIEEVKVIEEMGKLMKTIDSTD